MSKANFGVSRQQICRSPYWMFLFACISVQSIAASEFGFGGDRVGNLPSAQVEILPVEVAFRLTATEVDGNAVLYWQIQPGYYLYRNRLNVDANKAIGELAIPKGIEKTDEYFGEVEVYFDELEVIVPINARLTDENDATLEFTVTYQGCAEAGICYPPQIVVINP